MSKNFDLVWEDNPDTPITAQNLSKSVTSYTDEDRILFWDFNDSNLKLKANSKATIINPVTNAFLKFENTMVSHNGKFIPTTASNITYRYESTVDDSRSLACESGTSNFIVNSSFESGTTSGWAPSASGSSSVTLVSSEKFYGSYCIRLLSDSSGNTATLEQTATTLESTDASASFSFYYKSDKAFNLSIIGNPSGDTKYWRSFGSNKNVWENLENIALTEIPASTKWTRYEVKNITTSSIKTIKVKFETKEAGTTCYIDAVQLENKEYCSSYISSSRNTSQVTYSSDILNLEKGSIDMIIMPKYLNSAGINTIFTVPTISKDALKLRIDTAITSGSNLLVFSVYDTETSSEIMTSISLEESTNFIDEYVRIICNWNKSSGISINLKYVNGTTIKSASNTSSYTPFSSSDLVAFDLGCKVSGGVSTEIFEGLIDKVKINNYITSNTDITANLLKAVTPDDNNYELFENQNCDIVIDASLLDTGSSFIANNNYYVWITKNANYDTSQLLVSLSDAVPNGKDVNWSKLIGGFRTDASATILENTIWDLSSHYKNLLVNRFVTFNDDTGIVTSEMYNTSTSSVYTLNAPLVENKDTTFNANNTFNTGTSTFNGNVIVTSKIDVGKIRLTGNTISGINSDVVITNNSSYDIYINSNTGSTDSKVYIDHFSFKDNTISTTSSGYNLCLTSPAGANITLTAGSSNVIDCESNVYIQSGRVLYFGKAYQQFINLGTSSTVGYGPGIGIQTDTFYTRSNKNFAWYEGGSHSDSANASGTGGTILAMLTDGAQYTGTMSTTSRFYAGRVHNAIYNDLAECWDRDIAFDLDYNEVAVQTIHGIRQSVKRAEKGTVGIVSDSYGFLLNDKGMNEKMKDSTKAPICISGRAKVRVIGKNIEIGDEIVSYKFGTAIKANFIEKLFKRDRIVGRIDSHVSNDLYWVKV